MPLNIIALGLVSSFGPQKIAVLSLSWNGVLFLTPSHTANASYIAPYEDLSRERFLVQTSVRITRIPNGPVGACTGKNKPSVHTSCFPLVAVVTFFYALVYMSRTPHPLLSTPLTCLRVPSSLPIRIVLHARRFLLSSLVLILPFFSLFSPSLK